MLRLLRVLNRPIVTYYVTFSAAVTGLLGLCCSVMIYVDTHRVFWRAIQTAPRIYGAGIVLALSMFAPLAAAIALLAKILWEQLSLLGDGHPARLQCGPLRRATGLRLILGLLALIGLLARATPGSGIHYMTLALVFSGEMTERYLFFRAVDAPKMPGMGGHT